ncbi:MAG: hypothetical protein RR944_02085 [Acinetobacter sp.]|uniref:hypothetical protein n=1 Tax=Acinetobacter sp. TaxID=472 RepID=UPI002FCAEA59
MDADKKQNSTLNSQKRCKLMPEPIIMAQMKASVISQFFIFRPLFSGHKKSKA